MYWEMSTTEQESWSKWAQRLFHSSGPLFSCLGTKWGSTSATGTQAVVGKPEVRILGNGKGNPVPRPACF